MGAKSYDGNSAWYSIINLILSVSNAGRRNNKEREAREEAIMAAIVYREGWTLRKKPSNTVKKLYTAKSYMTNGLLILYAGKYSRISSYIRKPFLIYDFATAPL